MKRAKPEDRRDYWKYHVAAHSLSQAHDVAGVLTRYANTDPLFYPLMISLHVLYGRPFRHQKEARNIDNDMVPAAFTSVHTMLLQMRDRIFAHHDKDSRITDSDTGVDLFQLVVVAKGGEMRPGIQTIFPTDYQLGRVRSLCEHLKRECMKKAEVSMRRCLPIVPPDGIYRVSTDFDSRAPLLIRSEISTEQSVGHLRETRRSEPGK